MLRLPMDSMINLTSRHEIYLCFGDVRMTETGSQIHKLPKHYFCHRICNFLNVCKNYYHEFKKQIHF